MVLADLEVAVKEWFAGTHKSAGEVELRSVMFEKGDVTHEMEDGKECRMVKVTLLVNGGERHLEVYWDTTTEWFDTIEDWDYWKEATPRHQVLVDCMQGRRTVNDVLRDWHIREDSRLEAIETVNKAAEDYRETLARIQAGVSDEEYNRHNCHHVVNGCKDALDRLSEKPLARWWE